MSHRYGDERNITPSRVGSRIIQRNRLRFGLASHYALPLYLELMTRKQLLQPHNSTTGRLSSAWFVFSNAIPSQAQKTNRLALAALVDERAIQGLEQQGYPRGDQSGLTLQ
jgi:hypothetical protein